MVPFWGTEELIKIDGQGWSLRKHAGEYLQVKMLHILVPISPSLDLAYPAIHSFDETERNPVLGFAPRRDALPMALHHPDHFLERSKAFPLEPFFPGIPELTHTRLGLVRP
jgi:hypothetical protein